MAICNFLGYIAAIAASWLW